MQVKLKTRWLPEDVYEVRLRGSYVDGSPAFILERNGEPWMQFTIYLAGEHLNPGHIFIKDYGENEGIIEALAEAGLIEPVGRVAVGYTSIARARMLEPLVNLCRAKEE